MRAASLESQLPTTVRTPVFLTASSIILRDVVNRGPTTITSSQRDRAVRWLENLSRNVDRAWEYGETRFVTSVSEQLLRYIAINQAEEEGLDPYDPEILDLLGVDLNSNITLAVTRLHNVYEMTLTPRRVSYGEDAPPVQLNGTNPSGLVFDEVDWYSMDLIRTICNLNRR